MIKTVLVPIEIDHIEAGASALEMTRALAGGHDAEFILLNVVEALPSYFAAEIPASALNAHREGVAGKLKQFVQEHGLPETTEVVVRRGHASKEILEYAEERGVDLIVIASHDPGFADYFLGSTAGRVVRHAHCSVLVAR